MAERPEYSIELRARALAMIATGRSHRDVARELGIQPRTLGRWARAAKPATVGKSPEPPAAGLDLESDPLEGVDPLDTLAMTRAMQQSFLITARKAQDAGNYTAAGTASRQAALLAPTIKNLEKARGEESDWIKVKREEVDRLVAGLREKVEILAARGMLCAECSRALSIAWGGVEDPPDRSDKIGVRK